MSEQSRDVREGLLKDMGAIAHPSQTEKVA
jgi:hypothetical protein